MLVPHSRGLLRGLGWSAVGLTQCAAIRKDSSLTRTASACRHQWQCHFSKYRCFWIYIQCCVEALHFGRSVPQSTLMQGFRSTLLHALKPAKMRLLQGVQVVERAFPALPLPNDLCSGACPPYGAAETAAFITDASCHMLSVYVAWQCQYFTES